MPWPAAARPGRLSLPRSGHAKTCSGCNRARRESTLAASDLLSLPSLRLPGSTLHQQLIMTGGSFGYQWMMKHGSTVDSSTLVCAQGPCRDRRLAHLSQPSRGIRTLFGNQDSIALEQIPQKLVIHIVVILHFRSLYECSQQSRTAIR